MNSEGPLCEQVLDRGFQLGQFRGHRIPDHLSFEVEVAMSEHVAHPANLALLDLGRPGGFNLHAAAKVGSPFGA